jgi:Flp pilus assembly protein TadD
MRLMVRLTTLIKILLIPLKVVVVSGCAQYSAKVSDISPLLIDGIKITPVQSARLTRDEDLLALNDEMRHFVDRYISPIHDKSARITALNNALFNRALIGIEYDHTATTSAIGAYSLGRANCVGFANVFVAMGRYAGLDSRYQQVKVKPNWERRNGLLYVPLHINVITRARMGSSFIADIDRQRYVRASNKFIIKDNVAHAQYFNNLAMDALALDDVKSSYSYLVKGITLAPDLEFLWSNLGYMFRRNNQFEAAEISYLTALALDSRSRNAMKNLAILYQGNGRVLDAEPLLTKVERLNRDNPYGYANKAFEFALKADWPDALKSIDKAIQLRPEEIEFRLAKMKYLFEAGEISKALLARREADEVAINRRQTANIKSIIKQYAELIEP